MAGAYKEGVALSCPPKINLPGPAAPRTDVFGGDVLPRARQTRSFFAAHSPAAPARSRLAASYNSPFPSQDEGTRKNSSELLQPRIGAPATVLQASLQVTASLESVVFCPFISSPHPFVRATVSFLGRVLSRQIAENRDNKRSPITRIRGSAAAVPSCTACGSM